MSVYTVVNAKEIQDFLKQFDLGELIDFEGISAGIENTNYFVDTTEGRYVLTIFEHHTVDELVFFMSLMSFMAQNKIATASPMQTHDGKFITQLKQKPASLVQRLSGKSIEEPSQIHCKIIAKNMAKFHIAGQGFSEFRANDRDLNWIKETFYNIEKHLPQDEIELIKVEMATQSSIDWDDCEKFPQSIIHADLFCDNALFDGDELVGIIDWYYACKGNMIYDVAVVVNEWCREVDSETSKSQINTHKMQILLDEYQKTRPFTESETKHWQQALGLASLRFFLSRLKDKYSPREGDITQIKNPDVFKNLLVNAVK